MMAVSQNFGSAGIRHMAAQSKIQFRMKDLLWAVFLISTSVGILVAVRRLGMLREQRLLGYTAHDVLVTLGLTGCLACFVAGFVRLFPKFWMGEIHLGVTLIGVSLGAGLGCVKVLQPVPEWAPFAAIALFVISGTSLGAGIGAFFGKPIWAGFRFFVALLFVVGYALAGINALQ